MSDFDKWFTEHVDDFVEGEYARFDCQLAWKARQQEIDQLKERIASRDDVIYASRLVIEEYERKLKQLRTETSMSVIKDTISNMLK